MVTIPGAFNSTSNEMKFGSTQETLRPFLVKREPSKVEVKEDLQLLQQPVGIHLLQQPTVQTPPVITPQRSSSQYPANMHEDHVH
jgi:hypothetical protein